ncbi:MAG: hypothetical protein HC902_06825 [Calothrix sp. SM1_5_4]|nr:hypothetical protein [Calothrix sp. SM1_5_4]
MRCLSIRFADHAALKLLALIPVLLIFAWFTARRTRGIIHASISPKISDFLLRSLSARKRKIKIALQCLSVMFFVLALARPQSGEGKQRPRARA